MSTPFPAILLKDLTDAIADELTHPVGDAEAHPLEWNEEKYTAYQNDDLPLLAASIVARFVETLKNGELNANNCESCAKIAALAE